MTYTKTLKIRRKKSLIEAVAPTRPLIKPAPMVHEPFFLFFSSFLTHTTSNYTKNMISIDKQPNIESFF